MKLKIPFYHYLGSRLSEIPPLGNLIRPAQPDASRPGRPEICPSYHFTYVLVKSIKWKLF
jgi:hypothetical protein